MTSRPTMERIPVVEEHARGLDEPRTGSPAVLYLTGSTRERPVVRDRLARLGFSVTAAADSATALQALSAQAFALCLLDLVDDRGALATIRALRAQHPHVPLIGLLETASPLMAAEALQAGITDVLHWPFEERDLAVVVANSRDRMRESVPVDAADGDDVLFTQSPAMQHVLQRVRAVADMTGGVCLSGEPGTGRTLVARAIHGSAPQGGLRPFVIVNCADESPMDLERHLFGVIERAQNGSAALKTVRVARESALAQAHGGTLLLRNVVEAPARVQAKLARILRDGEATLEDGRTVMELDVRPMAAVDHTLEAALADGRLRKDLFGRLSHARIDVPPLSRRPEDVPQLAVHFLRTECVAQRVPVKSFSRAALRLLVALPWHGNAGELRALVNTLVRSVPRPVIELDDLLERASLDGVAARLEAGITLRDAKARFERDCISAVLIRHHGRVGEAAKALGIQRTNLYRKVRQLNVARSLLSPRR